MNGLDKPQKKLNIAMVCDPITDYIAGVFKSTTRFSENLRDRGHKIIFIAAKSPFSQENNCYSGMKVYRFRSVLLPKTESRFRLALPTVAEVKEVLKKSNVDKNELVAVLLAGGSSKIPLVRKKLTEYFGDASVCISFFIYQQFY